MLTVFLNNQKSTSFFLIAIAVFALIFSFAPYPFSLQRAEASDANVRGFAWSDNIGWISFNNSDVTPEGADYGVNIDPDTRKLSGDAWSESIGWISFDRGETGVPPSNDPCPDGSCTALLTAGYKLDGWARALNYGGGWDGWIKLNGIATDSSPYGVTLDTDTKEFEGWAYGSDVIGWIIFCDVYLAVAGNNPPIINSVTDWPDPVFSGNNIQFSVNWTDPDAGDQEKIHICKTNSITGQVCSGGSWCDSSSFGTNNPMACNYAVQVGDEGSNGYYAFVCDDDDFCSSSTEGNFTVGTFFNATNLEGSWSFCSDALHPILVWGVIEGTPTGYDVEIYSDGELSNLIYEYKTSSSSSTSHYANFGAEGQNYLNTNGSCSDVGDNGFHNSPRCNLNYESTYWWRVRVKNNKDDWGNWSEKDILTVESSHHWPKPSFSIDPISPQTESITNLFGEATVYGGSTVGTWEWGISGVADYSYVNSTDASSQNPNVQFNTIGGTTISLQVTDDSGYGPCGAGDVEIFVERGGIQWYETSPTN